MPFTFLHTADWQLGKPFGGFAPEKREVLREARIEAIDRLAAAARNAGASHVLVAGDIYDGDVAERDLRRPLEKMAAHKDITWHLLPGNHDLASCGPILERAAKAGPAGNVLLHLKAEPYEVSRGVYILPAPLTSKSLSSDPTAWMDDAATPKDAIRIGLAHGSVRGFGSDQEAAVLISPNRPKSAGLAYLALGDWHGVKRINDRVWYSGTPEPDQFPDNRPGFALVVRIDGPKALPKVEEVQTAAYVWHKRSAHIDGADDLSALAAEVEDLAAGPRKPLLRLELLGAVALKVYAAIEARLDDLEHKLFHLERHMAGLHVVAADADLEMIGDGELRACAKQLQAIAADFGDARAPAAELALRKLYVLAHQAQGGA